MHFDSFEVQWLFLILLVLRQKKLFACGYLSQKYDPPVRWIEKFLSCQQG